MIPGYWMHETSGVLRPVVERYLRSEPLSESDIATMRAYLRQWVEGDFRGPGIPQLRADVDQIVDNVSLADWLVRAEEAGIDPL